MSVCFHSKRVIYYTGISAEDYEWDRKAQEFRPVKQNQGIFNDYLKNLKQDAINIYRSLSIREGKVNPEDFRRHLKMIKIEPGADFFTVYLNFVKYTADEHSKYTYLKCRSLYNHLKGFSFSSSRKLILESVDPSLMNEFVRYLDKKDLGAATIEGYIKVLKWFMRWCRDQKLLLNRSYEDFSYDRHKIDDHVNKTDIIYLRQNELFALMRCELNDRNLDRARDIFCFMALSGCRFNETMELTKNDITSEMIEIRGRRRRSVPIHKTLREIMEKYQNKYYLQNRFFPNVSVITMNKYLRILLEHVGLKRLILIKQNGKLIHTELFHAISISAARNTFIYNALRLGLAPSVIARWSGSKTYSELLTFVTEKDLLDESLNKLNTFDAKDT